MKTCKQCGHDFEPSRPMQTVCGPLCARKKVRADNKAKKEAAKADRAQTKERKQALKTIPQLEEECRKIVQEIARVRDRNDGCISCDLPANWDGQWHGSHLRAHGAASAVQFNLWNIHKACWICNKIYSGRINVYEPRVREKIGNDKVDWLYTQNQVVRNSREYLARFKQVMGKRLRRMKRAL